MSHYPASFFPACKTCFPAILLYLTVQLVVAPDSSSSSSLSSPSSSASIVSNVVSQRRRAHGSIQSPLTSIRPSDGHSWNLADISRGGSVATRLQKEQQGASAGTHDGVDKNNNDDDNDDDVQDEKERIANEARKWRLEQQMLFQLRSTILSEALAKRGVPIATFAAVSTKDQDKPPEPVDWECLLNPEDDPKQCMFSLDTVPNVKMIAPVGSSGWISLKALNRLRRTDPSKVEPMWHSKYSILKSWFSDSSEYSLLQHLGFRGFLVSGVLLQGLVLKLLLVGAIGTTLVLLLPILEYLANRFLVSQVLWARWTAWSRFVHAALPLKLLLVQMTWRFLAGSFSKLEEWVREYVVELECAFLEESVPVTVNPEADGEEDEVEEVEQEQDETEESLD